MQRYKGFTLIELSIVFVVIGLLIGGILAAKSMIATANVLQTIRQLEQYATATRNFQTQYNCLPGDCAKSFGFKNKMSCYFNNTTITGDGDGIIGTYGPSCYIGIFSYETYNYWAHLEQAGFIPPVTTRPTSGSFAEYQNAAGISSPAPPVVTRKADGGSPVSGGWWVFGLSSNTTHSYIPAGINSTNVFFLGFGNRSYADTFPAVLRNYDSVAIDAKIDDGLPLSGNVQAVSSIFDAYNSIISPTHWSAGKCINSAVTPNQYKLSGLTGTLECGLIIGADF